MNIKCINNNMYEGNLTLGEIYEIVNITDRYYFIKDDNGFLTACHKNRFEIV